MQIRAIPQWSRLTLGVTGKTYFSLFMMSDKVLNLPFVGVDTFVFTFRRSPCMTLKKLKKVDIPLIFSTN